MIKPEWKKVGNYEDIVYEKWDGIARITINRPEVRNAFRPLTVREMQDAFVDARDDGDVGVVILTGAGDMAFCSGGDQRVRGEGGYVGDDGVPRLKSALNADCDGQAGLQEFAGNATLLYYLTDEALEGKKAFLEKRKPNYKQFKRFP